MSAAVQFKLDPESQIVTVPVNHVEENFELRKRKGIEPSNRAFAPELAMRNLRPKIDLSSRSSLMVINQELSTVRL